MRGDPRLTAINLTWLALFSVALLWPSMTQAGALDRSVLPIPEPKRPAITTFDARNVKAPPRFEVKPPAGAPNLLIVLIDDMGFGMSSAYEATPVTEGYKERDNTFTGKIHKVTIELKEPKAANATEMTQALHEAAKRKTLAD